jgi:hypothetical protein
MASMFARISAAHHAGDVTRQYDIDTGDRLWR